MKRKIAFLLFGISYLENFTHFKGGKLNIDYKNSIQNYKEYLFEYYKNYDIDIFISTNKNKYNKDLINDFKPKSYILRQNISNHILSKNNHVSNVIDLCLSYAKKKNIKYDFVILTRFDLKFKIKFDNLKINYNMVNIVSKLHRPDIICDNFYIIPFDKLHILFNFINRRKYLSAHRYQNFFIKRMGGINYILNENTYINKLKFYEIVRNYI